MTEKEMLNALQNVWKNMTMDKDRQAYSEILVLLDNMRYFLSSDLLITYPLNNPTVQKGEFDF